MTDAEIFVERVNNLPYDEHPYNVYPEFWDWQIKTRHLDSGRWSEYTEHIIKCPDGSYFAMIIESGLTEYQDADPDATAYLVEPVEMLVIDYKKMEN